MLVKENLLKKANHPFSVTIFPLFFDKNLDFSIFSRPAEIVVIPIVINMCAYRNGNLLRSFYLPVAYAPASVGSKREN